MSIRYYFLLLGVLLCFIVCACSENPRSETSRGNDGTMPNVIILLADDLGFGDLGCYGSQSIETPNIDALASEGVRFTNFYSGSAVCSPSRASLFTGKYPLRFDIRGYFTDNQGTFLNLRLPMQRFLMHIPIKPPYR